MKIKMEIDENLQEEEIIVRCRELSDDVVAMQRILNSSTAMCFACFSGLRRWPCPSVYSASSLALSMAFTMLASTWERIEVSFRVCPRSRSP